MVCGGGVGHDRGLVVGEAGADAAATRGSVDVTIREDDLFQPFGTFHA